MVLPSVISMEAIDAYGTGGRKLNHLASKPITAALLQIRCDLRANPSATASKEQDTFQPSSAFTLDSVPRPENSLPDRIVWGKLPIRSHLRTVKGSKRHVDAQSISPSEDLPSVKAVMQLRQAENMVNNELHFRYRGSVSGWKLSPIRDMHRKKLHGLPPRPNSTLPDSAHGGEDYEQPARPRSTDPWNPLFQGVQGSNMKENSAAVAQQFSAIQRMLYDNSSRHNYRRDGQPQPPSHTKENDDIAARPHRPDTTSGPKVEHELQASPLPTTASRTSTQASKQSAGMKKLSRARGDRSSRSDTSVWSGDWINALDADLSLGGAEPYLTYLKSRTASNSLSSIGSHL
jgi:hypothetical protein